MPPPFSTGVDEFCTLSIAPVVVSATRESPNPGDLKIGIKEKLSPIDLITVSDATLVGRQNVLKFLENLRVLITNLK